jgi:hypothetical protein
MNLGSTRNFFAWAMHLNQPPIPDIRGKKTVRQSAKNLSMKSQRSPYEKHS